MTQLNSSQILTTHTAFYFSGGYFEACIREGKRAINHRRTPEQWKCKQVNKQGARPDMEQDTLGRTFSFLGQHHEHWRVSKQARRILQEAGWQGRISCWLGWLDSIRLYYNARPSPGDLTPYSLALGITAAYVVLLSYVIVCE